MKNDAATRQLVNAPTLLSVLFERQSRPSLRWLREQTRLGRIPTVRAGHLVFYDPVAVRVALETSTTKAQT